MCTGRWSKSCWPKGLTERAARGYGPCFMRTVPLFSRLCLAFVLSSVAPIVFAAAQESTALPKLLLDLSLEPPVINTNPGPEYADEARPGNMIIGVERTPKGRLWACWVRNGDSPNGFFMLATSDDGGTKWSKPRVV